MLFKIELGSTVQDKITGYKGLVTGRHEYLYGCRRYTVQAQGLKDGKVVESVFVDEDALNVLKAAKPQKTKDTGGPLTPPPQRRDPQR